MRGGIDISLAIAASVVQCIIAVAVMQMDGGNWPLGLLIASPVGFSLGAIYALFIHDFRISSIVVTIATFNAFFGFLMSFTYGVSIHNHPDWWLDRVIFYEHETASGDFIDVRPPAVFMLVMVLLTWLLINRLSLGRQLFAIGDNPDGASNAWPNSTPCPPRAQRSSLVAPSIAAQRWADPGLRDDVTAAELLGHPQD